MSYTVPDAVLYQDAQGKTFKASEVIFVDIDDPGAQFLGWVTKESRNRSSNMDLWVKVTPLDKSIKARSRARRH